MASDLTLPGQLVPLPRGPIPQLGSGIYSRDGQARASLVGVPRYEGSVGLHSSCLIGDALNDIRAFAPIMAFALYVDFDNFSRTTSSTIAQLSGPWISDTTLAIASNVVNICCRWHTTAGR